MKTKKKGLYCSRLSSFGAQVSRGDTAESNGADLASCPQIQGWRPKNNKKRSSAQNLRLSIRVHTCFSSWNEILLMLGRAQAVFWEALTSKCTPVAPGLLLFLGAQSTLGEHTSRLGGHKKWFGEHGPEVPPVVPDLSGSLCLQESPN